VLGKAHFLQRHAGLLDQADQLRRLAFDALFQVDLRLHDGRSRRSRSGRGGRGGRRGLVDFAAEVLHQRIEAAIETLAHGHAAPAAILAVNFCQHDGFFLREIRPGKCKAGQFAPTRLQAHVASLQLRHHTAAIDGGRHDEAVYAGRQARQLQGKLGRVAATAGTRLHAAARRARLVEKGHVALVG